MDPRTQELVAAIGKAMLAERTGHSFYTMAAHSTDDPEGKATFEQLAREELEHFEFLAAHYRSLQQAGTIDARARLRDHGEISADSPIFSAAFRARIQDAHFEMSALAIAVLLELNAIEHYRAQAAQATIPEVKGFFEHLATWETAHHDALLKQQEALQQEYWSASGFQPF